MSAPVFRNSGGNSWTPPAHGRPRQTAGRRRHVHGDLRPLEPEPTWGRLALFAFGTGVLIAFTWLAIPALAEWTIGL